MVELTMIMTTRTLLTFHRGHDIYSASFTFRKGEDLIDVEKDGRNSTFLMLNLFSFFITEILRQLDY